MNIINIFCCYALDDAYLIEEFKKHLSRLKSQQVKISYAHDVAPGKEWRQERDDHLFAAQIIILLVSTSFFSSPEYERDIEFAMKRNKSKDAIVIPVILRPVIWKNAPFGPLTALPPGGRPIVHDSQGERDQAFLEVVEGVELVIKQILEQRDAIRSDAPFDAQISGPLPGTINQRIREAGHEHFIEKYYRPALDNFRKSSDRHEKAWRAFQRNLISLSLAVALFVGAVLFTSASYEISIAIKLVVATLAFIVSFLPFSLSIVLLTSYSHEKWIVYQHTVHDLEKELTHYEWNLGLYRLDVNKEQIFQENVLTIVENAQRVPNPTIWHVLRSE